MLRTMKTRTFGLIMLGIVVLGSACSSGGGGGSTSPPSTTSPATTTSAPPASGASGGQVSITMVDFSFKPSTVTASTSQEIVLTNTGTALHNFSIVALGIDQDVQPGQSVTLKAPGSSVKPGTYDFFCKYHKSQGMVGTLNATSG
jgi:plastocyanin